VASRCRLQKAWGVIRTGPSTRCRVASAPMVGPEEVRSGSCSSVTFLISTKPIGHLVAPRSAWSFCTKRHWLCTSAPAR